MIVISWINWMNYVNGFMTLEDIRKSAFRISQGEFVAREWVAIDVNIQEDDLYEATSAEKFRSGWDLTFGGK